jgi:hypothetical protein
MAKKSIGRLPLLAVVAWLALVNVGCASLWDLFYQGEVPAKKSNREIFNSWVGHYYTELGSNIAGRVSYSGNSITYDSSWTETKETYIPSRGTSSMEGQIGPSSSAGTETYYIEHERWVTFYFDENGIITTWRSYGW